MKMPCKDKDNYKALKYGVEEYPEEEYPEQVTLWILMCLFNVSQLLLRYEIRFLFENYGH